jgi:hypothetical protein
MMTTMRLPATAVAAFLILIMAGACGGDTREGAEPGAADERAAPETASSTDAAELTDDNLNAYRRGLEREIEAVREAQRRSSTAATPQERGEAIQASFDDATIPQGAEAAGLSVEEYRAIRETVNGTFRTLDFQGKIDGPLSMDLSRVDEETKVRLARDPFDALSSSSAAALRAQMDRLVPVWIEYVKLTAVAG